MWSNSKSELNRYCSLLVVFSAGVWLFDSPCSIWVISSCLYFMLWGWHVGFVHYFDKVAHISLMALAPLVLPVPSLFLRHTLNYSSGHILINFLPPPPLSSIPQFFLHSLISVNIWSIQTVSWHLPRSGHLSECPHLFWAPEEELLCNVVTPPLFSIIEVHSLFMERVVVGGFYSIIL